MMCVYISCVYIYNIYIYIYTHTCVCVCIYLYNTRVYTYIYIYTHAHTVKSNNVLSYLAAYIWSKSIVNYAFQAVY